MTELAKRAEFSSVEEFNLQGRVAQRDFLDR
jgi:hypothetical protein